MSKLSEKAARNLKAIRDKKPLIHNITNLVSMNYTANSLLAMGASPVMGHAENEVEEMVSLAGALILNLGTLTNDLVLSMIKAGKAASRRKTPIILDPVGAGATSFRTASTQKIIAETNISVLRSNASEVLSLCHNDSKTKGVDSVHAVDDAAQTAKVFASELKMTLAITGPVDFITEGNRVYHVSNGHPLMACVTGTGCAATATIGAFMAVDPDPVSATVTALAYFGLAGEIAGESASAPGSFMIGMLDALYTITPEQLKEGCKIGNG